MKKLLLICLVCLTTHAQAQQYVFFLHNMWLELVDTNINTPHPEYGRAQYYEVIDKFKKAGLTVISELRPRGTNGNVYAIKVAHQIDSLLKKGVPASHITVVGTSKGGYITMCVSGIMKNTAINYVLVGCCEDDELTDDAIHLLGNILSIYETSDKYNSCQQIKAKPGNDVKRFKEIVLHTNLKHGFLYRAMDEWIKPASRWAKGDYK
ncbi:MAG: alpha/beta hydrolase [Bacteroidetes bacterium]|nr:alpha/beta hydrolase [Bacteroidota bacterium]